MTVLAGSFIKAIKQVTDVAIRDLVDGSIDSR